MVIYVILDWWEVHVNNITDLQFGVTVKLKEGGGEDKLDNYHIMKNVKGLYITALYFL